MVSTMVKRKEAVGADSDDPLSMIRVNGSGKEKHEEVWLEDPGASIKNYYIKFQVPVSTPEFSFHSYVFSEKFHAMGQLFLELIMHSLGILAALELSRRMSSELKEMHHIPQVLLPDPLSVDIYRQ